MKALVKVTMWKEVELPENMSLDEAIGIIKNDNINGFFDCDLWRKYPDFNFNYEEVENTEQDMTIEENNGHATLKLVDEDEETLWSNLN